MQTTISNEFLTVTIDTHGAEVVSVKNSKGEELIWQADPAIWDRHSPVLFPWAGRLANGELIHNGKHYSGGQHGFIRDLEHILKQNNGISAQLMFRADEETKTLRFPFDFESSLKYRTVMVMPLVTCISRSDRADISSSVRMRLGTRSVRCFSAASCSS